MSNSKISDFGMGQIRKLKVEKFRADLSPIKIFFNISNSEFKDLGIGQIRKL